MAPSPISLPPKFIRFTLNFKSELLNFAPKFLSSQSSSPNFTDFSTSDSRSISPSSSPANPNPNTRFKDFHSLFVLLQNSHKSPSRDLVSALDDTGIEPTSDLLRMILRKLGSSPMEAFSLVKWAEKRPGYILSAPIFNSMLGILARKGEFKLALMELLEKMKKGDDSDSGLVSDESFRVLIRQFARSGEISHAIRTFQFASSLEIDLFEVLLNELCRYGHVRVGSDCVDRKMHLHPDWIPSVGVYNVLLDGWFRVRNPAMVEQIRLEMRAKNLLPDVSTYGIIVEGYCRMGFVDKAVELLGEIRGRGIRVHGAVYDPIVVSLARAGRLKEALRMMEVYMVLENGPTLCTYNALVRGFCDAGDLVGAGKILKMMTSRGVVPTSSTYGCFFRYFEKNENVEDALNLYRKMMDTGYDPDERKSNVIVKMLCEKEELESALEITKEIRCRDPAIITMLIDLLCKNHRLKEAVVEFENLIRSGFVPEYIVIYQTLHKELKKKGLHKLASKLSHSMVTVSRSTASPVTVEGLADVVRQRRKTVMHRAKAMSDVLKNCSDPKELAKRNRSDKASSGKQEG